MKKLILLGLMSAFADCSEAAAMRRFEKLAANLHEELPFDTTKSGAMQIAMFSSTDSPILFSMQDNEKFTAKVDKVNSRVTLTAVNMAGLQLLTKPENREIREILNDIKEIAWRVFVADEIEEIPDECFKGWKNLSRVVFGESSRLIRIGKEAFHSCNFQAVYIPAGVEELCEACFYGCRDLSRVTFHGSNVRYIGKRAFRETDLREIHIPDSVEKLYERHFYDCDKLTRVTFGEGSVLEEALDEWCPKRVTVVYPRRLDDVLKTHIYSRYDLEDMPVFQPQDPLGRERETFTISFICRDIYNLEWPVCLPQYDETIFSLSKLNREFAEQIVSITIPENIEIIDHGCFMQCRNLRRVTFGENSQVEWIKSGAFNGTKLEEITIPSSVKRIDAGCFRRCESLSSITFEPDSSLTYLGAWAFGVAYCYARFEWKNLLREVQIPDSVEEICEHCFFGCEWLSRVTFGEGSSLKSIGRGAFSMCRDLVEISIPEKVEELCDDCFSYCKSLSRVTFGEMPSLKCIGRSAFRRCGLREIRIPDSVEELCELCFCCCRELTRVTFGEDSILKRIGREAFSACGHIVEMSVPGSVEELCYRCFSWCNSLSKITFSKGSGLRNVEEGVFWQSGKIEQIRVPAHIEHLMRNVKNGFGKEFASDVVVVVAE